MISIRIRATHYLPHKCNAVKSVSLCLFYNNIFLIGSDSCDLLRYHLKPTNTIPSCKGGVVITRFLVTKLIISSYRRSPVVGVGSMSKTAKQEGYDRWSIYDHHSHRRRSPHFRRALHGIASQIHSLLWWDPIFCFWSLFLHSVSLIPLILILGGMAILLPPSKNPFWSLDIFLITVPTSMSILQHYTLPIWCYFHLHQNLSFRDTRLTKKCRRQTHLVDVVCRQNILTWLMRLEHTNKSTN